MESTPEYITNPLTLAKVSYGSKIHHSLIGCGIVDHLGQPLPQEAMVPIIRIKMETKLWSQLPKDLISLIFLASYEFYPVLTLVAKWVRDTILNGNRTKWIEWVVQRRANEYITRVFLFRSREYVTYQHEHWICNKRTGKIYRNNRRIYDSYKLDLAIVHIARFSSNVQHQGLLLDLAKYVYTFRPNYLIHSTADHLARV